MSAIETEHLRLLPYSPVHLLALIVGDREFEDAFGFPAAQGMGGFLRSSEVSPAWLARLRVATAADPWEHGFAVLHRDSKSVIGSASFKGPPDSDGVVEIAYGIVPQYQSRGYATEAARALLDYAFGSDDVRVVRAHTLAAPNASTRVLTKCGFQLIGDVIDPEDGLVWRWERSR
jgi:RimJ/RimL family protein N-acetyltransferase